MATLYACDATGTTVKHKDDLVEVGVRGRLYCDEIAQPMQAYVKEVDALHDECAAKFQEGLDALRVKYRRTYKMPDDGKLPDE